MSLNPPTTGDVTFLFTDIEGSTRLLQALADDYATLLDAHRRLLGEHIEQAGGHIFGTEGDAIFAAFPSAGGAISAAAGAQQALAAQHWPRDAEVRVRMGIHTGPAQATAGDYVGLALHQVARITGAGHGGQVLVSEATRQLAAGLPRGLELRDMGEHRLKDLARPERLYQLVGEGLADGFPPLRTLDGRPNNLPVQLTSFVGREELAGARQALDGTRLLSLTGPGGTGKTRMALQLAAEASDDFPDGVYFVALDGVTDPELVPSVIAATIDLRDAPSVQPLDRLIEHLRDKRVLLVLDNFEQIVEAAPQVARLLREAPNIKVIVTTRIVLKVYGEREFPVPPLGLPAPSRGQLTVDDAARSEAVQLFVERAMGVQPSFTLNEDNAAAIVNITRRLDGLPLAIELAAARVRVLPVTALAARLDRHLSLLTGGARDLPERQQTLRGAIDWSYDLLEEADRRLFERFSVHAGGAFLNEADATCGPPAELGEDVLDGLSSLADNSLVRAEQIAEDPRFAMLATIRDYARERLESSGDIDELRRRHAAAYLAAVESVANEFIGPEGARWGDRLELDHDNLRQALDWMVEQGETEMALRFIAAIWRFWQTRGHIHEAREQVDRVTAMPGLEDQPPELLARAYAAAGGVCYWQADTPATHRYYGLALEAARRTGDKPVLAEALYNFGFASIEAAAAPGNRDMLLAGREYFEQSLALYTELGNEKGIADAGWALAASLVASEDPEGAYAHAERSLESYRRLGDHFGTGWAQFMLAGYDLLSGRPEKVRERLREALQIFAAAHDQSGILGLLGAYWLLAERDGQTERQHLLGGAVEALSKATGMGLIDAPMDFMDLRQPDKPVDDPEAMKRWEEGAAMPLDEVVAYALEDPPA